MAHFAKVNDNGVVENIIVIADEDCGGGNYPESEPHGQAFIGSLGIEGTWKQTSYNNNFRKKFANQGYLFLAEPDVFVEPKPYPSWNLNSQYDWVAPVTKPEDENHYIWNEESQSWDLDQAYHFENEFID
jgi:hypothetical protein